MFIYEEKESKLAKSWTKFSKEKCFFLKENTHTHKTVTKKDTKLKKSNNE